jgi:very-short-patch-repair endonuclease
MYFLPYNKSLREFSRELRNHSTLAEILIWQKLRAGSLRGYNFNRQKPLGNYIVDFYCKKLDLVIEIDGDSHEHEEVFVKDILRQEVLEDMGLAFLRFTDWEVKKRMNFVLTQISQYIDEWEENQNPPNPLCKGGVAPELSRNSFRTLNIFRSPRRNFSY